MSVVHRVYLDAPFMDDSWNLFLPDIPFGCEHHSRPGHEALVSEGSPVRMSAPTRVLNPARDRGPVGPKEHAHEVVGTSLVPSIRRATPSRPCPRRRSGGSGGPGTGMSTSCARSPAG